MLRHRAEACARGTAPVRRLQLPGSASGGGDRDAEAEHHGVPEQQQAGAGERGDEVAAGGAVAHEARRADRSGSASSESSACGTPPIAMPPATRNGVATATLYAARVPCVAEPHRQRALAGELVGGDVAQVVGQQDRDRERADRDAAGERQPR